MPHTPSLVAFDLDDTLAPSKSPLPDVVATSLSNLLTLVPVCVISGGNYAQFEMQLLSGLRAVDESELERLHLMPTCGTQYFRRRSGSWERVYAEELVPEERSFIAVLVEQEARRLGLWESDTWGPVIEDRGSQVTFSALGQAAPVDAKKSWDPDGTKKSALRDAVAVRLPHLEVRSGGSTSIDITKRGIDKAYGIRKLAEVTGLSPESMLFVGDRLDEDGNDYPVISTGIPTRAVEGWEETVTVVDEILDRLRVSVR